MGDRDRSHRDPVDRGERHPRGENDRFDLGELHELTPWSVGGEEARHAISDVERDRLGRGDFASEVDQPRVMPDVRVGEQNGVDGVPRGLGRARHAPKERELRPDRRSRFDEHSAAALAVEDPEARGGEAPPALARFDAAGLLTPDVGETAVLGDPEDDEFEAMGGG